MIHGIRNIGNSCYMASVVQCLRRVRKALGFPPFESMMIHLSGEMEDVHEFYLQIMDRLAGTSLAQELSIEFMDGSKASFLMLNNDLEYDGPKVHTIGRAVCAYILPNLRYLSSVERLIIHECYNLFLVGAIAFCPERRHYYALIEQDGRFLRCDDSYIVDANDGPYNLCMLFFVYVTND